MTLHAGHELATALATLAALLAVLTGGQLHPGAWACLAAIPVGALLQWRKRGLSTALGGFLALSAIMFGVLFTVGNGLSSILLGAGYALCLLVVVRLLNRETTAHDLQLYALSLLLVLDAAALNISWVYAPCFLAYTVSIVWALTTRELKRSSQEDHLLHQGRGDAPLWREAGLLSGRFFAATAVISVAVLIATLSLFIVFPRVGLGMLRLGGGRSAGFAQNVQLGAGGTIAPDTTVVMRVTAVDGGDDVPRNLYFRGAAFDLYDGNSWSRSEVPLTPQGAIAARMPRPQSPPRRIRVALEPLAVPFLFAPGFVSRVTVEPSPRLLAAPPVPSRDGLGDLRVPSPPDELLAYELETDLRPLPPPPTLLTPDVAFPDALAKRYLDVTGISPRAAQLARDWTAGATTPWEKVSRMAAQLRQFSYTAEDPTPPFGVAPLDHFLFTRRAGHCEYFATALAMMSRSLGVPARMVGGYQGGAYRPAGGYLVLRQSDAHAWVEIYAPDLGWVPVDAVPLYALARPELSFLGDVTESLQKVWEDYVVDFSLGNQVAVAQGMAAFLQRLRNWRPAQDTEARDWLIPLGESTALVVAAWLAWKRRHLFGKRSTAGARLARAIREAVVRVAGHAPSSDTVRQWVTAASLTVTDEDRTVLEQARDAFERCRYGGMPMDAAEETRLSQAVARINLPRRPARG